MCKEFKYLLFDLGGVLVELTGGPDFMKWTNFSVTNDEFNELWLRSESVRLFESGKIPSHVFAEQIVKELGLSVGPDEFLKAFSRFPIGMFEGAEALLESLSKRYSIACLSNTNPIHWEWMSKHTHLEQLLHKCLLSFRTGFMKPDMETFVHAAKELACKPQEVIFFDDNPTNVAAATEAGFRAFLVKDFKDLTNRLRKLGIIAAAV